MRKNSKIARSLASFAALLFALPATVMALSTDRDKPLDVDAHYMKTDQNKQTGDNTVTYLKGDVKMDQGSIKARSDEATVWQDAAKKPAAAAGAAAVTAAAATKAKSGGSTISRALFVGKPAHLEQLQDNDGGLMKSDALTIDYHVDTNLIEMTGNVVVVQGNGSEMRSDHMIYNTLTGEMESGDSRPESRVKLRMMPKPADPAAKKPDDAKAAAKTTKKTDKPKKDSEH
jgi:lipopolysaccharide export system protein LptA